MHSSQNEQDSRWFADFAHVPCLEPSDQQEAYEMTRVAFELSETFHVPVMLRLVTRLAHSRAGVQKGRPTMRRSIGRSDNRANWILLPVNARRQWRHLLDLQPLILSYSESSSFHKLLFERKLKWNRSDYDWNLILL
jgi:indolepyruvate ferredoxin oxidoreductase alpha subunit